MNKPIKFRPHHFLCTLGFAGKGYSQPFINNYLKICEKLDGPKGAQTPIQVVDFTDDICAPCPNRREKLCVDEEKINQLDQQHAAVLDIKPGDTLSWGEAKQRIRERFTTEKFHSACSSCEWKALGFCEKALSELKLTT